MYPVREGRCYCTTTLTGMGLPFTANKIYEYRQSVLMTEFKGDDGEWYGDIRYCADYFDFLTD